MAIVFSFKRSKQVDYRNEKVVLLNTREVFDSAKEAKKKLNLKDTTPIIRVCRGIEKSAGKIDGQPLIWVFYNDYKIMDEYEINRKLNQSNNKPVICINTNEIFYYLSDASRKYNVNPSSIARCCKGKQKTAGIHQFTKEKLRWKYYRMYS